MKLTSRSPTISGEGVGGDGLFGLVLVLGIAQQRLALGNLEGFLPSVESRKPLSSRSIEKFSYTEQRNKASILERKNKNKIRVAALIALSRS